MKCYKEELCLTKMYTVDQLLDIRKKDVWTFLKK